MLRVYIWGVRQAWDVWLVWPSHPLNRAYMMCSVEEASCQNRSHIGAETHFSAATVL